MDGWGQNKQTVLTKSNYNVFMLLRNINRLFIAFLFYHIYKNIKHHACKWTILVYIQQLYWGFREKMFIKFKCYTFTRNWNRLPTLNCLYPHRNWDRNSHKKINVVLFFSSLLPSPMLDAKLAVWQPDGLPRAVTD